MLVSVIAAILSFVSVSAGDGHRDLGLVKGSAERNHISCADLLSVGNGSLADWTWVDSKCRLAFLSACELPLHNVSIVFMGDSTVRNSWAQFINVKPGKEHWDLSGTFQGNQATFYWENLPLQQDWWIHKLVGSESGSLEVRRKDRVFPWTKAMDMFVINSGIYVLSDRYKKTNLTLTFDETIANYHNDSLQLAKTLVALAAGRLFLNPDGRPPRVVWKTTNCVQFVPGHRGYYGPHFDEKNFNVLTAIMVSNLRAACSLEPLCWGDKQVLILDWHAVTCQFPTFTPRDDGKHYRSLQPLFIRELTVAFKLWDSVLFEY